MVLKVSESKKANMAESTDIEVGWRVDVRNVIIKIEMCVKNDTKYAWRSLQVKQMYPQPRWKLDWKAIGVVGWCQNKFPQF